MKLLSATRFYPSNTTDVGDCVFLSQVVAVVTEVVLMGIVTRKVVAVVTEVVPIGIVTRKSRSIARVSVRPMDRTQVLVHTRLYIVIVSLITASLLV